MMKSLKGAVNITGIVVDIALVCALIPVIKTFISNTSNLTSAESVLLGLTTLFIIIALIVMIVKQAGFGRNK